MWFQAGPPPRYQSYTSVPVVHCPTSPTTSGRTKWPPSNPPKKMDQSVERRVLGTEASQRKKHDDHPKEIQTSASLATLSPRPRAAACRASLVGPWRAWRPGLSLLQHPLGFWQADFGGRPSTAKNPRAFKKGSMKGSVIRESIMSHTSTRCGCKRVEED